MFNTNSLAPPLAPNLAAELSQVSIEIDKIKEDFVSLCVKYQIVIVEGAGGLFVPLKGTSFLLPDLIKEFNLPVIIVARPDLGTINHTVLTVRCAKQLGLKIKGIIYNGFDINNLTLSEKTNPEIIEKMTNIPTLGKIPKGKDIDIDTCQIGNTLELIKNNVDFDLLLNNT
ncbi:dethiobiotin synthase [Thermincola potens]|uniref:Dethiobiotin synthase n=1 Tax=Thermincola potens (strain JR) TaxID=635013 RepID=D5XAK0_THEPJ|nr:dethiobiotin synthase [Thermincola potens]ADG81299.1 dithiobiotin synthetase [Thermincola potens JR]